MDRRVRRFLYRGQHLASKRVGALLSWINGLDFASRLEDYPPEAIATVDPHRVISEDKSTSFQIEARNGFYCDLIEQEIRMYQMMVRDNPGALTRIDFDALCERRGFNAEEIEVLLRGLNFGE